jgi:WhiB family redox-sensing transcriptional regulator
MDEAVCRGAADPELFFPVSEVGPGTRQVNEAKAVCARCPVRPDCLAFALEQDLDGVWGGTTEEERRAMRRVDRWVA